MYAYTGPEVARLKTHRFRLEVEKNEYARRAKKDGILTIGSAAVLGSSVMLGWALGAGPHLLEGTITSPEVLAATAVILSIPASIVTGSVALPFWIYNSSVVREKNASIAQTSEELKQVEKGTF